MMVTTRQVVDEARLWVGVPYRHQGRSRSGVDCVGLIIVVMTGLGIMPDGVRPPANYTRRPKDGALERQVVGSCVKLTELEVGCLILMRWAPKSPPSHCAIYTGENIVHAHGGNSKVVEHGYRAKWPGLAHSFWRLPGVEAPR